jgi:hypothetical protein
MTKTIRSLAVLAATACLAGSMGFAQSAGEAVYKANCQSCHGSAGTPSPGIAKMMGVKAASDPDMKKLSEADDEAVQRKADRCPDQGCRHLLPLVQIEIKKKPASPHAQISKSAGEAGKTFLVGG